MSITSLAVQFTECENTFYGGFAVCKVSSFIFLYFVSEAMLRDNILFLFLNKNNALNIFIQGFGFR